MGAQLRRPYRPSAGLYPQHPLCGDAAHGFSTRGPRRIGSDIGRLGGGGRRQHPRRSIGGRSRRGPRRQNVRGSSKQGAPGVHLLSALSHHLGLTLAQQAVDDKTNEITQVETVLRQLVLPGRVLTMDALFTQRQVAQTIVDAGGDYVMIVKNNQPQLRADIELVFTLPPAGDRQRARVPWTWAMVASSSAISRPVRPW